MSISKWAKSNNFCWTYTANIRLKHVSFLIPSLILLWTKTNDTSAESPMIIIVWWFLRDRLEVSNSLLPEWQRLSQCRIVGFHWTKCAWKLYVIDSVSPNIFVLDWKSMTFNTNLFSPWSQMHTIMREKIEFTAITNNNAEALESESRKLLSYHPNRDEKTPKSR